MQIANRKLNSDLKHLWIMSLIINQGLPNLYYVLLTLFGHLNTAYVMIQHMIMMMDSTSPLDGRTVHHCSFHFLFLPSVFFQILVHNHYESTETNFETHHLLGYYSADSHQTCISYLLAVCLHHYWIYNRQQKTTFSHVLLHQWNITRTAHFKFKLIIYFYVPSLVFLRPTMWSVCSDVFLTPYPYYLKRHLCSLLSTFIGSLQHRSI